MGKNNKSSWGNNGKKKNASDGAKKILSGVLFMAACFLSVYVLVAHSELVWLVAVMFVVLMAAAYFFLGQLFNNTEEQIDDLMKAQEALEAVKKEERNAADAAFKRQVEEQMKSMDRTTRAMFLTMKKSAEAQAAQLADMESRIDKAIDEQNAGIKTIIKYNKENARQVAQSSKDSLEKMAASLTDELKAQARNQVQPAVQYVQMPMPQPVYQQPVAPEPVYGTMVQPEPVAPPAEEPVVEEPVIEEPAPSDGLMTEDEIAAMLAGAMDEQEEEAPQEEFVFEEPAVEEPVIEEPVIDEPAPSDGLMTEDEIAAMLAGAMNEQEEEPVVEAPFEEAAPVASEMDLAAATGVDLSDPNASLSADDIAKLFAAANSAADPVPEEVEAVSEETVAPKSEMDLAAATGVDLSDPNASLSADDIAKLFAAAGN